MLGCQCHISCESRWAMADKWKEQRLANDPFTITDVHFVQHYRLPSEVARELVESLRPFAIENDKSISIELQVLCTLAFYAHGSYQYVIGISTFSAMCQSSISKYIESTTNLIVNYLMKKYIRFPQTNEECTAVSAKFLEKHKIPGVIALIDGTHIALTNVKKDIEFEYVNRKGFKSVNTQIICGPDNEIFDCDARFPRSCHDSYIWSNNIIYLHLKFMYECGRRNFYILGDSGYALQPWLLPPYRNPVSQAEKKFNKRQKKCRSLVERTIGILKGRFRCLHHEKVQRYSPEKMSKIIVACSILHNIMVEKNVPFDESLFVVDENINPDDDGRAAQGTARMRAEAESIRLSVATCSFIIDKPKVVERPKCRKM